VRALLNSKLNTDFLMVLKTNRVKNLSNDRSRPAV
jgi:hypothetical protein